MKKIPELLLEFVNREKRERTIGRFYASELNSIIKGYLTPKLWLNSKPIDLRGARMILTGQMAEDKLTEIFKETKVDCECQVKKELEIAEGIVVVSKPDYVFEDFILETKFNFSGKLDGYYAQCESYYQTFKKPVKIGILSVPFDLRLVDYKPSKLRWSAIVKKITEFNKRICEIQKQQKK